MLLGYTRELNGDSDVAILMLSKYIKIISTLDLWANRLRTILTYFNCNCLNLPRLQHLKQLSDRFSLSRISRHQKNQPTPNKDINSPTA